MEELAAGSETTIAGGDVVRGPVLAVTVAVTGWADSEGTWSAAAGPLPGTWWA